MSLQPTARPAFLALVEEHLASLVRSAVTVQRHCKRARLMTATATAATNATAPVSGDATANNTASNSSNNNNNSPAVTASRLHASDINLALQLQGSEKLYGVVVPVVGGADSSQQKISLQELLQQSDTVAGGSSIRAPTEVALRQQWLAVNGEVPEGAKTTSGGDAAATTSSSSITAQLPSDSLLRVHRLQASLLSEELKLYYHRVTTALENAAAAAASNNADADDNGPEQAAVDSVLARLATDRGLQELVPFFVLYAQQQMLGSLRHNGNGSHNGGGAAAAAAAVTAVRLCRALLHNRHLHLELHLQELLPCWVTCIALPASSASTNNNNSNNNAAAYYSYPLRQQAALAVAECLVRYGADYATLKPGVLKGLVQHTITGSGGGASSTQSQQQQHNWMSRYGGWTAIALLGSRAIRAFLLPVAAVQWSDWDRELSKNDNTSNINSNGNAASTNSRRRGVVAQQQQLQQQQLHMCQQALLQAVAKLQRHGDDPTLDAALRDQLADRTVAMARRYPEHYYYYHHYYHSSSDDKNAAADDDGVAVVPEYHACFV